MMSATLYPTRYGTRLVTIDELFQEHHVDKMHPEFARRLRCWLESKNGHVGIGGSWREDGSQPDKPGFAPEGKSLHQFQQFSSGLIAFAAVDLVCRNGGNKHRAPRWDEVPVQGSTEAAHWGVHCNVSSEPWHMQPVISHIPGYDGLDGWQSFINAGNPDLMPFYPIPCDSFSGDDMNVLAEPRRIYDSRQGGGELRPGQTRKIPVTGGSRAHFNITCVSSAGKSGFVTVAGHPSGLSRTSITNFDDRPGSQVKNGSVPVAFPDGHLYVQSTVPCHVIVDVFAIA